MAVLVSDSFNRADNTTLGSTDSYNGGTTKTWTYTSTFNVTTPWSITSNAAGTATAIQQSKALVDIGISDNIKISLDLPPSSAQGGIAFRHLNEAGHFVVKRKTPAGLLIQRSLGGGDFTTIASGGTVAYATAVRASVELQGSTINLYENSVLIATVTDTANLANTKHGMVMSNDTVAKLDNFQIDSLDTGTPTGTPGSALLQAVGTLTASGTVSISGGAALSGSGSLTATGIPKIPGAAQLSGTGSLTATGSVTLPGNISGGAALTAAGSLTALGLVVIRGGASLQGTSTLTASGKKTLRLNPYVGGERTLRLQDMLNIVAMKYPHAYDNEDIVSLINDAQARLFRTNYRVNTATTFDLYADNAFYPINFTPENIIDVVVDGKEYPYQNIKYDAQSYYYYVTNGNAIGLYPAPTKDVISGMTVLHYKEPAELSASDLSAIPEFDGAWHMIIVYYVCRHLAEIARDTDMVNNFTLEINDIENEYKRSKRAKPHRVQDVYGVGRG